MTTVGRFKLKMRRILIVAIVFGLCNCVLNCTKQKENSQKKVIVRDGQTMCSREEEIEEVLERDVFEIKQDLSTVEIRDRYLWEDGGDSFLYHFRKVEKGWTMKELIEHSGLPAPYEELEVFLDKYEKKVTVGDDHIIFTYGVPPSSEGGFYHKCVIEIDKGKVHRVDIDWGHVSLLPGAFFEPKYKKENKEK